MTIVKISKAKIIEAIEKEPITRLEPGTWIDNEQGYTVGSSKKEKNCSVCAVGAVMRNACLNPKQDAYRVEAAASAAVGNINCTSNSSLALSHKNYMAALSAEFESGAGDLMMPGSASKNHRDWQEVSTKEKRELKKQVISFVKKNFPKFVEIDINGAKPAKDVKVVSK